MPKESSHLRPFYSYSKKHAKVVLGNDFGTKAVELPQILVIAIELAKEVSQPPKASYSPKADHQKPDKTI